MRRTQPTIGTGAEASLPARPADYLLGLSTAVASLPVVGRHLQPLGGATAMAVWGCRHLPDLLSAVAKSWLIPGGGEAGRRDPDKTAAVSGAAQRGVAAAADLDTSRPTSDRIPPVCKALWHRRHVYRTSVRYGHAVGQVLDVWRRTDLPAGPAPVMIFVPGGAWVHGSRILQGYALMSHLAERGWVCLSIDYRVSPHHRWPQHIIDVKTAVAWARANVDNFGGDRNFIAIAGCSAGGHLAALAGLTADDPEFHDALPQGCDTSVDAVVAIYGRYDWEDRSTAERARFVDFLERVVVNRRIDWHPEVFRAASPIARVRPESPPFLVIHGSADTVIPVGQAHSFVERLQSVSGSVVGYLELPGAGHGFDLIDGTRARAMATEVGRFLEQAHHDRALATAEQLV